MTAQRVAHMGIDNHDEALSVWLDLFRWLAAFAVLISHVRHRLFISTDIMPESTKSLVFYIVGGISSFGPPAVIIFFVLSGFLVGGSSFRNFCKSGHFAAVDYLVARLSRLWIVLIPTLILTYCLNMMAAYVFGRTILAAESDPGTFVCNIAFLQTAFCPQYGSNGSLWSLFNEFWYYISWPMVMIGMFSQRPLIQRFALLGIAAILLCLLTWRQFVGPNIAAYFSIWLLGVWAASRERPFVAMPVSFSVALSVLSLMIWHVTNKGRIQGTSFLHEFPVDLFIGLTFANMILIMKYLPSLCYPPFPRIHAPLAGFSFTLYCLHTPVINWLTALLHWSTGSGLNMMPTGPIPYILFGLITMICIGFAYSVSLLTERHTSTLRKWVMRAMPRLRAGV